MKIRKINPLGFRVVVKIMQANNSTDAGLLLPQGAKDKMAESMLVEVVEVASATNGDHEEETNVSGIPLGAMALIKKDAGVRVPWDDSCRIVDTQEVLAIIEEISLS